MSTLPRCALFFRLVRFDVTKVSLESQIEKEKLSVLPTGQGRTFGGVLQRYRNDVCRTKKRCVLLGFTTTHVSLITFDNYFGKISRHIKNTQTNRQIMTKITKRSYNKSFFAQPVKASSFKPIGRHMNTEGV